MFTLYWSSPDTCYVSELKFLNMHSGAINKFANLVIGKLELSLSESNMNHSSAFLLCPFVTRFEISKNKQTSVIHGYHNNCHLIWKAIYLSQSF